MSLAPVSDRRQWSPEGGNRVWKVTTAPTIEPVTVAELKTYMRLDTSAEDDLIEGFITAVREAAEEWLGRSLLSQTITMSLDFWPNEVIRLPRPLLISVTEIRTLDESDSETTYSSSNYYVRTIPEPGEIALIQGASFPENTERDHGGYEIEFVAGYGTSASDVPNSIRQGIKLWAALIYENRVPIKDPPKISKSLMSFYRVLKI